MNFGDGVVVGYALARNKKNGGGSGTIGSLKAVVDDGAANLSIIMTAKDANTEYPYTYIAKLITDSITTSVTGTDGTVTTNTKSWSKYLIDKLYNVEGKIIMQAVYFDESKGVVSHYLDSKGAKIYLDSEHTADIDPTDLSSVDAIAVAYAIARNQESALALQELKKAYRKGIADGDNGRKDTSENFEEDENSPINIDEPDDRTKPSGTYINDPAITDLTNGIWYSGEKDGVQYTIKIYVEPYNETTTPDRYGNYKVVQNILRYTTYVNGVEDHSGSINSTYTNTSNAISNSFSWGHMYYENHGWSVTYNRLLRIWIENGCIYTESSTYRPTANNYYDTAISSTRSVFPNNVTITSTTTVQPF